MVSHEQVKQVKLRTRGKKGDAKDSERRKGASWARGINFQVQDECVPDFHMVAVVKDSVLYTRNSLTIILSSLI